MNPFEDIIKEMKRQDEKWGTGRTLDDRTWVTVLTEELGEVAKATLERNQEDLREEIVQCAAVCIQWLLDLDNRAKERA